MKPRERQVMGTPTRPVEIEVEFDRLMWERPARTYGDPEDCHPAEGDDERSILAVFVGGKVFPASPVGVEANNIWGRFIDALQGPVDELEGADLDRDCYDPEAERAAAAEDDYMERRYQARKEREAGGC